MPKQFKEGKNSTEAQATEGSDVLENKVQTGSEIPSVSQDAQVTPGSNTVTGEIKNISQPKSVTNTSKAASLVDRAGISGGIMGTSLAKGVSFSGSVDIGKDMSATTRAESANKSGSRTGKRSDPITKQIDTMPTELFKVEVKGSKPLCESDEKQGYAGNYDNEHAITQKVNGGAPADPMFGRSADDISIDMIYFPHGQYNVKKETPSDEYAFHPYDAKTRSISSNTVSSVKGNYLVNDMEFTVSKDGRLTNLHFDVTDITNRNLDEETTRLAGDAALRTKNLRELERLKIVANASDESSPKYSPIGDGVNDPTALNHLFADNDSAVGAVVYQSMRKLSHALSFAINKVSKDGLRTKGPIAEFLNANIEGEKSGIDASIDETAGYSYAFSKDVYRKGGAGLWLAINDSLAKYNTKAKLLSLPLSFHNALNTAKANCAPLRVPSTFVKDVEHCELYSTVDNEYDPMMPVIRTDKMAVVLPFDPNTTFTLNETGNLVNPWFNWAKYEVRQVKNMYVHNILTAGIAEYLNNNASRIFDACAEDKTKDESVTIKVPVQSSMSGLSLWDLFICSATPEFIKIRNNSLKPVLEYEKNFEYPYSDVVRLDSIDITRGDNFVFNGVDQPLQTMVANPTALTKIRLPEVFWAVGSRKYSDNGVDYVVADVVLPHYFNQNQFTKDSNNDQLVYAENGMCMSYPSTRSGVTLSSLDSIYGLSEEDYRLSLDRMVTYPCYDSAVATEDSVSKIAASKGRFNPSYAYKYGVTNDGIPTIPYIVSNKQAAGKTKVLTVKDVIKTPRELGLHMVAPSGLLTPCQLKDSDGKVVYVGLDESYISHSGPGFTFRTWKVRNASFENKILQDAKINDNYQASFAAEYVTTFSTPMSATIDNGMILNGNSIHKGIVEKANDSFTFIPFTNGGFRDYEPDDKGMFVANEEAQVTYGEDDVQNLRVVSLQKYFWTRLQRLPFIINPFDVNSVNFDYSTYKEGDGNRYDIFDFLYIHGFCGFQASDFSELVYERNKARISKGMTYVEDPFLCKSILLK